MSGLTNSDKYFSLSSLFRVRLGMHLTHSECQFLARGLKYAHAARGLGEVKKRRDITLKNNYSNQYDPSLLEYACHLLLIYQEKKPATQVRQDLLIKAVFDGLFSSKAA